MQKILRKTPYPRYCQNIGFLRKMHRIKAGRLLFSINIPVHMKYCVMALIFLSFSSCASRRMIETDLYFGLSRPDGSPISEKEWNDFKETVLTRVFEKGSTTIDATGNWRDPDNGKLVTERSRMVIFHHEKSKNLSKRIDSVCMVYKKLFHQQSVLRVDRGARVVFE